MARARAGSANTSISLRDKALDDLRALIEATADARADMRTYQTALEKNLRYMTKGGRATDMIQLFHGAEVRASLTDRLNLIERTRGAARVSLWRLQITEGTKIADIARMWGFSRQLVSRALSAADPRRNGHREPT